MIHVDLLRGIEFQVRKGYLNAPSNITRREMVNNWQKMGHSYDMA